MASIFQDLGLVETVLGDLAAFAAGGAVSTPSPVRLGANSYNVSIQALPNGPAGTNFQVISGSFWSIFGEALSLAAELESGAPVNVAIKEGASWYGATLTRA